MRSPYIWAPINIGDWNTATQGLSLEEQGIVMKLLLAFWEAGEFPDEKRILRILGVSRSRWMAMQEHVGDAIATYIGRAGFKEERVRAAEITVKRSEAARNRWAKYRRSATQGLDANAYASAMTTTTTEETYTDKAEKLTRVKGLSDDRDGQKAVAPKRLNGRGWH